MADRRAPEEECPRSRDCGSTSWGERTSKVESLSGKGMVHRAGWGRGWAAAGLLLLLLSSVSGREAPEFVDILVGNPTTMTPDVMAKFPFVTPKDGDIFVREIGQSIQFTVAAETLQTGSIMNIVFEESSSMFTPVESCTQVPQSQREWCPPNNPIGCDCRPVTIFQYSADPQIPPTTLTDPESFRFIPAESQRRYRTWRAVVQRFQQRPALKMCFRALDCDPAFAGSCRTNEAHEFDTLWYPRRCISIYVIQAPLIRSIFPRDAHMALTDEPVLQPEASPTPPWRPASRLTSAKVPMGGVLELNVDASDPNDDDDIDVMATAALPAGAVLSERMCCDAHFTECLPRAPGQGDCSEVCRVTCEQGDAGDNAMADCVRQCAKECKPVACTSVRRVLRMVGMPGSVGQPAVSVSFKARDNGGGTAIGAPARDSVVGTVTIEVVQQALGMIAPSPLRAAPSGLQGGGVPIRGYVNCPIAPFSIAVLATSAGMTWEKFTVMPAGCTSSTYMQGSRDLSCLVPPCFMCSSPGTPDGLSISPPAMMAWGQRLFREGGSMPGELPMRELIRAGYNVTAVMQRQGVTITTVYVHVVAASLLSNTTVVVIRGISGTSPDSDSIMVTSMDGPRAMPRGEWRQGEGLMTVRVLGNDEGMTVGFEFSLAGSVSMAGAHVRIQDDGGGRGQQVDKSTGWAVLCEQCYVQGRGVALGGGGIAYGLGVRGYASESVVRWTPRKGQEGRSYEVCFKVLTSMQVGSLPPPYCLTIAVEKCSYCTLPGDSFESIAVSYVSSWGQIYAANTVPPPPPRGVGAVSFGGAADALQERTFVRLGSIYKLPHKMTVQDVLRLFATSSDSLYAANPDIPDEGGAVELAMGMQVCVLPGVCDTDVRMSSTQ